MSQSANDSSSRALTDVFFGEQKITRPKTLLKKALSKLEEKLQTSSDAESQGKEEADAGTEEETNSELTAAPGEAQFAQQPSKVPLKPVSSVKRTLIEPTTIRYVTAMPVENSSGDGKNVGALVSKVAPIVSKVAPVVSKVAPTLSLSGSGLTLSLGSATRKQDSSAEHYVPISFWMGLVYLGVGIACLVIAVPESVPNCGLGGYPPLRNWIYGTGIAYTIIGGLFLLCWGLLKSSELKTLRQTHAQPQRNKCLLLFFFCLSVAISSYTFVNFGLVVCRRCFHICMDDCWSCEPVERRCGLQYEKL
jgi:hypothetical protein